jgi:hypothetical protein
LPAQLAQFHKENVVKNHILRFVFLSAAMSMLSAAALAAPSCSNWMWQTDGSYWQQCVNDDGSRHCYRATDDSGSNATEISCS